MEENKNFTVSVYTENNIGILNRISAIFLKRHINIESMTVSKSEIENVHRFTFVVQGTYRMLEDLVIDRSANSSVSVQIVDKVLNFFVTAHFVDSYVCLYTLRSVKMLVPRI